jgi:hypothetical protein
MIEKATAIPHERFAAFVRHQPKPLFNFMRREVAYRDAVVRGLRGRSRRT